METDFDPSDRELCQDGACTGVLGADGRCKECGRSATGGPPERSASESAGAAVGRVSLEDAAEDFDPERQLCPDGACTGLIGADSRCKVCGAAAAP